MATRRKTARKKAAKKRAAKKRPAARKRVVKRKPARKAAKKRVARKPARRAAKKRATRKPARTAAKQRVAKKPKRKAAPKARARKPAPPAAFAPQKAQASEKDLLLFELERARVAVLAAIQGLGAGTAMQPVGEGRWTIHEIVLHLAVRDRVRIEEFDSLLAGNPASWANVAPGAEQAAENEAGLAPLRGTPWDDAVRMLMTTRAELMERLQAVPAEPAHVWSESHPFGAIMRRLPGHDRGHAETIKNARIAG